MRDSNMSAKRLGLALLAFTIATWMLACASERDARLHGWWSERGPVVRHEEFPTDCALCHKSGDWTDLVADFEFDHAQETGRELKGAHAKAQCLRCHNDRGPVQEFDRQGCGGCHEDVHFSQLGTSCDVCHGEVDWRPVGPIAEHRRTRFPLTGVHAVTECWRCHAGASEGRFSPQDTACLSCHSTDLARANSPNHLLQGWTSGCDRCHMPTTWSGAGFNHSVFPLSGGHAIDDCAACHTSGVFIPPSRECITCHLDDYNAVVEPDHAGLGFPMDCDRCHTIWQWQGAEFNHVGIVNGCVTCHIDEFFVSTDPDHVREGFPSDCEVCHDTNEWQNGFFDHPWPRLSIHAVFSCTECHQTPSVYTTFSCTHCHYHSERQSGEHHLGVRDYVWGSPQCVSCHPDGDARR